MYWQLDERSLFSMAQTSSTIPGVTVRGVASGVIFMAVFSTLWASIGTGGLQGWGGIWPSVVVVLIGAALLVGAISLILASRRLPNQVAGMNDQRGKRTVKWFILIFASEGILIAVASVVCNVIHCFDLFFPILALIVGAHFFPLAPLFELKTYYLVGALLCLLGILALFVIPAHVQISGHQINAQWVVLGFGAALLLWSVGVGLWLLARRLLALSAMSAITRLTI
jgi:hypothetical protein